MRVQWSGQTDLNRRPSAPKADALPDCAMPRFYLIFALSLIEQNILVADNTDPKQRGQLETLCFYV